MTMKRSDLVQFLISVAQWNYRERQKCKALIHTLIAVTATYSMFITQAEVTMSWVENSIDWFGPVISTLVDREKGTELGHKL